MSRIDKGLVEHFDEPAKNLCLNDILILDQPIWLSTNFMTLIPSLTSTDYEWFPWSICNGCGMPAVNAYPYGHLVPSPIVGLACAPIVETRFLDLAMSLLDFSPRIPLGTFSIFAHIREHNSLNLFVNISFTYYRVLMLTWSFWSMKHLKLLI